MTSTTASVEKYLAEEFSPEVRDKALKVIEDDRIFASHYADTWWVTPSGGGKRYRVQVIRVIEDPRLVLICTCPHGMNNGGEARCYHVAAALMEMMTRERSK